MPCNIIKDYFVKIFLAFALLSISPVSSYATQDATLFEQSMKKNGFGRRGLKAPETQVQESTLQRTKKVTTDFLGEAVVHFGKSVAIVGLVEGAVYFVPGASQARFATFLIFKGFDALFVKKVFDKKEPNDTPLTRVGRGFLYVGVDAVFNYFAGKSLSALKLAANIKTGAAVLDTGNFLCENGGVLGCVFSGEARRYTSSAPRYVLDQLWNYIPGAIVNGVVAVATKAPSVATSTWSWVKGKIWG